MSKEFIDFKEQFIGMRDDKSRLRLLKAWLSDHTLSCAEAAELLQSLFGLGNIAILAATAIQPQLTDPENMDSVMISKGFQFDDEKEDARIALGLNRSI